LRKNATEAEKKLWFELREFKTRGFYFRRQVPIGAYIVDFACLKSKLIVEVDGAHHLNDPAQLAHDLMRDNWLRSQGFAILRYGNGDVFSNKDAIVDHIFECLRNPELALPLEGGGGRRGKAAAGGGGDALPTIKIEQ